MQVGTYLVTSMNENQASEERDLIRIEYIKEAKPNVSNKRVHYNNDYNSSYATFRHHNTTWSAISTY